MSQETTSVLKGPLLLVAIITAGIAYLSFRLDIYPAAPVMSLATIVCLWSSLCFYARDRFGEKVMNVYIHGLLTVFFLLLAVSAIFAHTVEYEPIEGNGFFPWWIFFFLR